MRLSPRLYTRQVFSKARGRTLEAAPMVTGPSTLTAAPSSTPFPATTPPLPALVRRPGTSAGIPATARAEPPTRARSSGSQNQAPPPTQPPKQTSPAAVQHTDAGGLLGWEASGCIVPGSDHSHRAALHQRALAERALAEDISRGGDTTGRYGTRSWGPGARKGERGGGGGPTDVGVAAALPSA